MSIQKIKESELVSHGVSSLPSRPSLPSLYEGRPLTAKELREAFDKLPRLLAERFNALLDSFGLQEDEQDTLAEAIATGLFEGHSLAELFRDIQNGSFINYLKNGSGVSLSDQLSELSKPNGKVNASELLGVSGKTVFEAIEKEKTHADARASSLYRLSRVDGNELSLCLEVNKNGTWEKAGENLVLPEDIFIKHGSVFTAEADGVPEEGYRIGDKYLDLTLGGSEEKHIFIKVSDLIDTVTVSVEGEGDLITELTASGNTVRAKKGISSSSFTTPAHLEALEEIYVKKTALSDLTRKTGLLASAAEGNAFVYEKDNTLSTAKAIPEGACEYALFSSVGGMSYHENLVNERELATEATGFSMVYDEQDGSLLLNGSLSDQLIGYVHMFLRTPIAAAGKKLSFSYYHVGGSFEKSNANVTICFGSGNEGGMPAYTHGNCDIPSGLFAKREGESVAEDALPIDQFVIFCSAKDISTNSCSITFHDYRLKIMVNEGEKAKEHMPFGILHAAPSSIRIEGKNLIPNDICNQKAWTALSSGRIVYPLTFPKLGRYTLSSSLTKPMMAYIYLQKSTDGFETFQTTYLLTDTQNRFPYSFTVNEGESYRLWSSPEWLNALQDIQLEYGDATSYSAYHCENFPIPDAVQAIEGYGLGISDTLYNELDFENGVFVRRVGERDYIEGDENDETVLTDGIRTVYPLSYTQYQDISAMLFDGFLSVEEKGFLFFENSIGKPTPSEITFQIKLKEGENT